MKLICHDKKCLVPEKDETEFGWKIKRKGIRQSICRTCRANDRVNNPEKYQIIDRKRYHDNPEKEKARAKRVRLTFSEARAASTALWWEDNPDRIRKYGLKKNNITPEQYDALLLAQGGKCAVCESPEYRKGTTHRFAVDHDHDCCPGEVTCGDCIRGLLCSACNTAAGLLKENSNIAWRLSRYIEDAKNKIRSTNEYLSGEYEGHCGF